MGTPIPSLQLPRGAFTRTWLASSALRHSALASILLAVTAAVPHAQTRGHGAAAAGGTHTACDADGFTSRSFGGERDGFTLWVKCTGAYQRDLNAGFAMVERYWKPMLNLMGLPKPDPGGVHFGGDSRTDVYLLNAAPFNEDSAGRSWDAQGLGGEARRKELEKVEKQFNRHLDDSCRNYAGDCVRRDYVYHLIRPFSAATAVPDKNRDSQGRSSGFVLLDRREIQRPTFGADVSHELFHIFQYAHNRVEAVDGETGRWFAEATAEWASNHFGRLVGDRPAARFVHKERFAEFLRSPKPLHSPYYAYEAYIWPFFVEQEAGARRIAEAWKALVGVRGDAAVADVIDRMHPFQTHFRTFAIRNLNGQFGTAAGKRYAELDPDFPTDKPSIEVDGPVLPAHERSKPPITYEVELPSLKATYYRFKLAPDVREVSFDLRGLAPAGDLSADALVKMATGGWELRRIPGNGKLTFCRAKPKENLDEIYLVVSNHNRNLQSEVKGTLEVRPLKEDCSAWSGTITFVASEAKSRDTTAQNGGALADIVYRLEKTVEVRIDVADGAGTATVTGSRTSFNKIKSHAPMCLPGKTETSTSESSRFAGGGSVPIEVKHLGNNEYLITFTTPAYLESRTIATDWKSQRCPRGGSDPEPVSGLDQSTEDIQHESAEWTKWTMRATAIPLASLTGGEPIGFDLSGSEEVRVGKELKVKIQWNLASR